MRNLKKFLAVLVVVAMIATSMMTAFGVADPTLTPADKAAGLGILKGGADGQVTDEYLELTTQRIQTAIVYLRLLNLEATARAYTETTENFADADQVSGDTVNLLAYLKANPQLGWVGDGTNFNPLGEVTGQALYKVMLTLVGYSQGVDFDFSDTIGFARAKGFALAAYIGTNAVTNNSMAAAMIEALETNMNGKTTTLAAKLVADGVIKTEDAVKFTSFVAPTPTPAPTLAPLSATVASSNYREATVTFNNAVDATKLTTAANYKVGGTAVLKAVAVGTDNKAVLLTLPATTAAAGTVSIVISKDLGFAADTTVTTAAVIDSTVPAILGAAPTGNKSVKITLSEPVQTIGTFTDYKLDGAVFGQSAAPTLDGATLKDITIVPSAGLLTAGKHKITVASSIKDFAGYPLATKDVEFTIETDATPAVLTYGSATQTKVIVASNEALDTSVALTVANVTNNAGGAVTGVAYGSDGKSIEVSYDATNPLAITGGTIVVKGIKDAFGNATADTTVTIPAITSTIDTTKPVAKTAVAADQGKIVVTFDKNVSLNTLATTLAQGTFNPADAKYVLKDTAATPASYSVKASYQVDADNKPIYSQILLQPAAGGNFTAGNYTLKVTGVIDATPQKNIVADTTFTVTVPDKTSPTVSSFDYDGTLKAMYVKFSKAMNKASAETAANYIYYIAAVPNSLPSDVVISLLADNQTVKITSAGTSFATASAIQVGSAVLDAAGNATGLLPSTNKGAGIGAVATISSAKYTGPNTIVVKFSKALLDSSISINDFKVYDANSNAITLVGKSAFNTTDNANELTLTTYVNNSVSTNAKYGSESLTTYIYTAATADLAATDVYGQKLTAYTAAPAATITDAIAPTVVAVNGKDITKVNNNTFTMNFSELMTNFAAMGPNGQLVALNNGVIDSGATFTMATVGGVGQLTITLSGTGLAAGKVLSVSYTPGSTPTITDAVVPTSAAAFTKTLTND